MNPAILHGCIRILTRKFSLRCQAWHGSIHVASPGPGGATSMGNRDSFPSLRVAEGARAQDTSHQLIESLLQESKGEGLRGLRSLPGTRKSPTKERACWKHLAWSGGSLGQLEMGSAMPEASCIFLAPSRPSHRRAGGRERVRGRASTDADPAALQLQGPAG